jgi:hypothetical protein
MFRTILTFLLIQLLFGNILYSQYGTVHKGIYAIYETVNYTSSLKQTIPSSEFRENYQSIISSYPSIKLGYSYTAWGNLGMSDWSVWGIDFGAGLSYSKSIMNGYPESSGYYLDPTFSVASTNDQTFFNYYQPGNRCSISDYGVNMHFDAGTILYAGVELDAGPSRIIFTDNRIQGQEVRSTGWFVNTRIQGGLSIPLPLALDSYFKLNCKIYGIYYGWSGRFYKLDWVSDDKKLKNFSVLDIQGQPLGLGFSLTFLFEN